MSEYVKIPKDKYEKLLEVLAEYMQLTYRTEKQEIYEEYVDYRNKLAELETETDNAIKHVKELSGYTIEIDRN